MFFSQELLLKAFRQLRLIDAEGKGKTATERVSALRYFFATAEILYQTRSEVLDLSVPQKENRERFIKCVGNLVGISGNVYTNNFREEFLDTPGYAVANNFLTSALKRDGDYPGRPAPLLIRDSEKVKIHPNYLTKYEMIMGDHGLPVGKKAQLFSKAVNKVIDSGTIKRVKIYRNMLAYVIEVFGDKKMTSKSCAGTWATRPTPTR